MAPVVFIVFASLMVAFGIYAWRQEKKRRLALQTWCRRNGWTLLGDDHHDWRKKFPGLKLFDRGHSPDWDNIITGHFQGFPVTLMDFNYTTGSGKNRSVHHCGVTILGCDFPTIPLQIRREHLFDKVGEFLGGGDIDFESAEFSRTFHVSSADRKWAYAVIHSRTMEYLLSAPHYSVEFGFGELAIIHGAHCSPEQYEAQVQMAVDLYRLIPAYLVREMKGR